MSDSNIKGQATPANSEDSAELIKSGHVKVPVRNVVPVAMDVVARLSELWDEWDGTPDKSRQGRFIPDVFRELWLDEVTGLEHVRALDEWEEMPKDVRDFQIVWTACTSCAYAIDAIRADESGNELEAWHFIADATFWLGVTQGAWGAKQAQPMSVRELTKRANDESHKENRAMRAQALAWYEANRHTLSKNDAAGEIAGKVVPAKYKTVRDWLKGA